MMLFAARVPFKATVPAVPLVPAEKFRSSDAVGTVTAGAKIPVESVLQKTLVPQVAVDAPAAPEPAVVPLLSQ